MTEQVKQDLENIKSKILGQIKTQYDEQKAQEFTQKINSMNDEEFISFLKQQGIIKEDGTSNNENQCIFCSMVSGEIPTTKIAENNFAIAILELNPISKGHSLIIPKEHLKIGDQMNPEIEALAQEVSKELQIAFEPSRVDKIPAAVIDHVAINLIPVYSDETINSTREKKTPEDLSKLKEELDSSKKEKPKEETNEEQEEKIKQISDKDTIIPRRIP